jgi:hypothetical protein
MAIKNYRYASDSAQLQSLLNFAMTFILVPDLRSVSIPGLGLQLDLFFKQGSCGDEDGMLQIDAFPPGPGGKAHLILVTSYEHVLEIEQAGLYTLEEFYQGLRDGLQSQIERHPELKENAEKLIEKFQLESR